MNMFRYNNIYQEMRCFSIIIKISNHLVSQATKDVYWLILAEPQVIAYSEVKVLNHSYHVQKS